MYQTILGRKIPLLFFMSHPNIHSQAGYLTNETNQHKEHDEHLVKLNTFSTDNQPMIMIPPVQGEAIYFMEFSKNLEHKYNCYGVNYGTVHNFPTITSISKHYAEKIRKQFPDSKHKLNLLGFSMGVPIAFEIVKTLESFGYRCDLVLVDRSPDRKLSLKEKAKSYFGKDQEWLDEQVKIASEISPDTDLDVLKKRIMRNRKLQGNYITIGTINASILCIQGLTVNANNSMQQWKTHTAGKFWIEKIESYHNEIFDNENFTKLCQLILKSRLD